MVLNEDVFVQMFVFDDVVAGASGDAPSFHEFSISGETFEPKGDITMRGPGGGGGRTVNVDDYPALRELATICSLCNDASLDYNQVGNYSIY